MHNLETMLLTIKNDLDTEFSLIA